MPCDNRQQLAQLRLHSQRVATSDLASPQAAARWMLAMQAQDLPGARWSVGLRVPGSTVADVNAALARGEIVRSWPLRGTLHLVAAENLAWLLALTAPRMQQAAAGRHRQLELDADTFARAREVAVGTLEGGRALSRRDLFAAFSAHGISSAGQRGPHLLAYLCQSGTLCLGPMQGAEQAIVLLREWVPKARQLDRDQALGELALSYFASHGPATVPDLKRWAGLTTRDAALGLAVAGDRLESWLLDDTRYWLAAGTRDGRHARRVQLLPGFDEYLLGYADRRAALAEAHREAIVPGGNGMFLSTIVSDGQVVGTWRRRLVGGRLTITPAPFAALSAAEEHGFATAARDYATFLGVPFEVLAEART
ncbi:MAG: AlkZ family DNA glycosylase [Chloroflexi bacterium]|nr:AlkZ family DNA glycosylase [Chloroflexota bacterium]